MKGTNNNLSEVLNIRISKTDREWILGQFEKTTERKLSSYLRKLILKEPLVKTYRNDSLESIIQTLIQMKGGLEGIANNHNQAVKKLQTYRTFEDVAVWLITQKHSHEKMQQDIAEIKSYIAKTADLWLQS